MIFPAWTRLVNIYTGRIVELMAKKEQPWEHLANSPAFQKEAAEVARGMVKELEVINAKSWREAAFKAGRGRKFYDALKNDIDRKNLARDLEAVAHRNASLIRSLPNKIAQQIARHSQELYLEGKRPEEVQKEIRRVTPHITKAHARLIARTEISRAETDVTKARAVSIEIPVYQWHTSEDSRVRLAHRKMNAVLVFWSDPPNPEDLAGVKNNHGAYHCGQIYNCRCVALPLISLDEVSWPAKVYRSGAVTRMTRANFAILAGYRKAA